MATYPLRASGPEASDRPGSRLSAQEGWELIFQSFGSAKELFAEFGESEAFLKGERAAWEQEPQTFGYREQYAPKR